LLHVAFPIISIYLALCQTEINIDVYWSNYWQWRRYSRQ